MTALSRRSFLEKCGYGALATGLSSIWPEPAEAAWGDIPTGVPGLPDVWPASYQPKKILEVFCFGGLSQWENFWVSEDVAAMKNWRNFQAAVQGVHWHCPTDAMPAISPADQVNLFATASGFGDPSVPVYWGPATQPLWRSDIFNRARVVVEAHDLLPHPAATPLNLTGHRLGHPRMAGTGSAIQHRAMSAAPRTTPYSFVLAPDNIGGFDFGPLAAVANGTHPGYAQPMMIRIGDPSFTALLQRSQMSPEADQLIRTHQARYRDHLRFHNLGDAIRSAGFSSYDTAVNFLLHAADLTSLLSGGVLTVSNGRLCGTAAAAEPPQLLNRTLTAINTATLLLTTGGARHVCVFDGGFDFPLVGNSYDTHSGPDLHISRTSSNLFNLCSALAAKIDPLGTNPTMLSLTDTMIVIKTEFGRDPDIEGGDGGRNHWPFGYVTVLIGGPITAKSIGGNLDISGVAPATVFSPTDVQGAVLLAAGVDPFAPENFGVGDFTSTISAGTEQGTRLNLKTKILNV